MLRITVTAQTHGYVSLGYTLLKIQITRFGLEDDFEITRDSIRHKRTGSEFLFYGLWRHIDEIKSLEGIDVCWIEEAHGLTKEQWEILEPTLRGDASQFWIIFNPKLVADFVYRTFVTGTPSSRIKEEIYGAGLGMCGTRSVLLDHGAPLWLGQLQQEAIVQRPEGETTGRRLCTERFDCRKAESCSH